MKAKLFLLGLLFIGFSAGSFAQSIPVSNKIQRNQKNVLFMVLKPVSLQKVKPRN